jgi:hypothetical protein
VKGGERITDRLLRISSCIDQLKPFMSALMRGVSEYTGLHAVMVFGGPIPERGGEIATVQ